MKIINTKLTQKEFVNANMVMLYRKPATWIFAGIAVLFLIFLVYVLLTTPRSASLSIFLAPILLGGMTPALTYIRARSIFNASNSRAKEKIEYEFQDNQLSIRGESFNAQFSWDKIYKVTGTKNWIFIWQNRLGANPIPRKDIWEGEIMKLKEILDANKVKNNL